MQYKKWQFLVIPNKDTMKWKNPSLQCVYMWICSFADDDGLCYPWIQTIATASWVNRRTVERKIKELENMWILQRTNRFQWNEKKTNLYQILLVDTLHSDTMSQPSDTMSQPTSDTMSHRTISNSLTKTKEVVTIVTTPNGVWENSLILQGKKEKYGDKIINEVIQNIKTACNDFATIYAPWPIREERKYAKHLSDPAFFDRIQQFNMDLPTFIRNIIKMWSVLPYAKPVNSAKNIYYNRPDTVSKTQKEKLKNTSNSKWVVHLS